jgi:hypothetical protein
MGLGSRGLEREAYGPLQPRCPLPLGSGCLPIGRSVAGVVGFAEGNHLYQGACYIPLSDAIPVQRWVGEGERSRVGRSAGTVRDLPGLVTL